MKHHLQHTFNFKNSNFRVFNAQKVASKINLLTNFHKLISTTMEKQLPILKEKDNVLLKKQTYLYYILLMFMLSFQGYSQFSCESAFYQILGADIEEFNITTGVYDDLPGASAPELINAAGYNRNDNLIYAIGAQPGGGAGLSGTGALYSIDENGTVTKVDDLTGEDARSVAGDVDADNNLWVRAGGGQGRNMKRVSLIAPYTVTRIEFTGANIQSVKFGDIVFIDGIGNADFIYGLGDDEKL